MHLLRKFRLCTANLLLCSLLACGGDSTGIQTPSTVVLLSGNAQSGVVGEELANPLVVKVTSADGRGLRGVEVVWASEPSGGTTFRASTTTDAEGLAVTRWRLGSAAGEQTLTATVDGLEPVGFTATANSAAAAVVVVSPDTVFFSALGDTLRLTARPSDQYGNALSEAAVQWVSLDTAVVEVVAPGIVRAHGAGVGRVAAFLDGSADTAVVQVRQTATTIVVSPGVDTVFVGDSVRLAVTASDANGFAIPDARPSWTSSNQSVATVDSSGSVRAVGPGTAAVTVSVQTASAQASIHVTEILAKTITAGSGHACVIGSTGDAYCWGSNFNHELGAPSTEACSSVSASCSSVPVAVSGGFRFGAISGGSGWTCAVTTSGLPYCWGRNLYGSLGDGTTVRSAVPIRVSGGFQFTTIEVGYSHSCGLTPSGAAYCWGGNSGGGLGDGTTTDRTTPVRVQSTSTFKSLSAGGGQTCGITTSDELLCWGTNSYGQLGDGTLVNHMTPEVIGRGLAFAAVAAGGEHTCALTTAGALYCWGNNSLRQLGTEANPETCRGYYGTILCRTSPALVSASLKFVAVAAGLRHTCAISTSGAAYCWGQNSSGELGAESQDQCYFLGSYPCTRTPVAVSGGHVFTSLAAGTMFTCGNTSEGATFCWGFNRDGQLGNGTTTNTSSPSRVLLP